MMVIEETIVHMMDIFERRKADHTVQKSQVMKYSSSLFFRVLVIFYFNPIVNATPTIVGLWPALGKDCEAHNLKGLDLQKLGPTCIDLIMQSQPYGMGSKYTFFNINHYKVSKEKNYCVKYGRQGTENIGDLSILRFNCIVESKVKNVTEVAH